MLLLVFILSAAAALALYLRLERVGTAGLMLALLRALAWGGVAALLVNPACRRVTRGTTVLLDASLSMTEPNGEARWMAALDSARTVAGGRGRLVLFGETPRAFHEGARPDHVRSLLLPALREAAARGGAVAVVTDGVVDDAGAIPQDLLRGARIVVLPRPDLLDIAVASMDLPATLRAGDTATAVVDVAAAQTRPGDSVRVTLLEAGREVARSTFAPGRGGAYRREMRFGPAPVAGDQEVRRYTVQLSGVAGDTDPRNDSRETAAAVARQSTITMFSDSPDWDSKWLAAALSSTSGVPVSVYVRLGEGGWRDARTLRPMSDAAVAAVAQRSALVIAHGTARGVAAASRWARRALWRWPAADAAAAPGDWYVAAPEFASPVGGALAGVAAESLPPLESALEPPADSVAWTGLVAQLDRRGRARPVFSGTINEGRRSVLTTGSGFWRWASKGGVSGEAYRALVAATADWLLEEAEREAPALAILRDSLSRGASELVPRRPVLASQPGLASARVGEPVPLRHAIWVYGLALLALVFEWIARRRRGLR